MWLSGHRKGRDGRVSSSLASTRKFPKRVSDCLWSVCFKSPSLSISALTITDDLTGPVNARPQLQAHAYDSSLRLLQQALSTMMTTLERSTPATPLAATDRPFTQAAKPQRVLACVLCQQRKVKCDKGKFPCANCVRSNAQCVPAATLGLRQRRRRFPERELLDRLRHYESLLRHNSIKFEPLHEDGSTTEKKSFSTDVDGRGSNPQIDEQLIATAGADQSSSPSTTVKSETVFEAKYALALKKAASQDD